MSLWKYESTDRNGRTTRQFTTQDHLGRHFEVGWRQPKRGDRVRLTGSHDGKRSFIGKLGLVLQSLAGISLLRLEDGTEAWWLNDNLKTEDDLQTDVPGVGTVTLRPKG